MLPVDRLWLATGSATPAVRRERGLDLAALLAGRPAQEHARRVAALHALCGAAHGLAATLALDAARGAPRAASADERQALRRATAREQVRRLLLDWPAQRPAGAAATAAAREALGAMPAWTDGAGAAPWADWLQRRLLRMPAAAWLRCAAQGGEDWLAAWCEGGESPVAAWLAAARAQAARLRQPVRAWLPDEAAAADWGRALGAAAEASAPVMDAGGPTETGPWTRRADPLRDAHDNAWMRLIARLRDAVQLALDEDGRWLASGSVALGRGQGLAWVEMARGVLWHAVGLAPGADGQERIAWARLVAPTDWNFHPRGPVAALLARLPAGPVAPRSRADWAVLAYDACVPTHWAAAAAPREPAHA
ncbi:hydrogenase maturation factor HoxV/HupK [Piscinibacter sakaiensis]|uniref:Hydrogenase maturation factor HoxV/HupK n=1 Tax=Piscinibacter sakaiensis TaxID=1547922 RepID=A0A0K8P8J0_PISS1|nr:hydrogenase maturation factor HoxV/HupK [Piscinibacter sakaiensis]